MFATCIFRKGYGYLQSLWYSMPEPHRPAVGLYDLPHQFEAQAVLTALGAGDICLPVQLAFLRNTDMLSMHPRLSVPCSFRVP